MDVGNGSLTGPAISTFTPDQLHFLAALQQQQQQQVIHDAAMAANNAQQQHLQLSLSQQQQSMQQLLHGVGPAEGAAGSPTLLQQLQQQLLDSSSMLQPITNMDGSVVQDLDLAAMANVMAAMSNPQALEGLGGADLLGGAPMLAAPSPAPVGRTPRGRRARGENGEGPTTPANPYIPPNPPGRLLSLPSAEAAAIFGGCDKFPIKGLVAHVDVEGHPPVVVPKSNVTKRVVKSGTGEAYRYRIYLPRCPSMDRFGDQPLHITHVQQNDDHSLSLKAAVAGSRAEYKAWRTVKVNEEGVWRVRHPSGRSRVENDIRGPDPTKPRCYQLSLPYSFMQMAYPDIQYPTHLDVRAVVNGEQREEVTKCTVTSHKASRNNPGPQIALGKANRLLAPFWNEKHIQLYGYQQDGPRGLRVWLEIENDDGDEHGGGGGMSGGGVSGMGSLSGQFHEEHVQHGSDQQLAGHMQDHGAAAMAAAVAMVAAAAAGDPSADGAGAAMLAVVEAVQQQQLQQMQQQQRGMSAAGQQQQAGALTMGDMSGLDAQNLPLMFSAGRMGQHTFNPEDLDTSFMNTDPGQYGGTSTSGLGGTASNGLGSFSSQLLSRAMEAAVAAADGRGGDGLVGQVSGRSGGTEPQLKRQQPDDNIGLGFLNGNGNGGGGGGADVKRARTAGDHDVGRDSSGIAYLMGTRQAGNGGLAGAHDMGDVTGGLSSGMVGDLNGTAGVNDGGDGGGGPFGSEQPSGSGGTGGGKYNQHNTQALIAAMVNGYSLNDQGLPTYDI